MKKDTREIYKVLLKHGKKVLYSEEFVRAFHQKHHYRTSVAEHTLQVAAISVRLCRFLKRHGIAVDERAAVRGALMHDLGMVGRREKYKNDVECSQRHPIESAKVARRLYPDLDQKTVDIIERHILRWKALWCRWRISGVRLRICCPLPSRGNTVGQEPS